MASNSTYKFLPPELADSLRGLSFSARVPVEGGRQGLHRSPFQGSSVEFAEYREYVPGDPLHLIDWAVYSRSDRYVIREFHEETSLRAHVMLDISASMDYQQDGLYSKLDFGSYLVAGIMCLLVNQGDSAGLMTFDADVKQHFRPVGTLEGMREILLALEELKPEAKEGNVEQAIHTAAEMVNQRSLFVIISDLLQEPEKVLRGIQHLRHNKHQVMVFHVLDGAELTLPFAGVTELLEQETGARIVIQADEVREHYLTAFNSYVEELRRGCTNSHTNYCLVDTRRSPQDVLTSRMRTL